MRNKESVLLLIIYLYIVLKLCGSSKPTMLQLYIGFAQWPLVKAWLVEADEATVDSLSKAGFC